ncbi:Sensor protein CpxA [compost metagenome]
MDPQLAAIIVHDLKNALSSLEGELSDLTLAPDQSKASQAHVHCQALREKMVGFLTLYKASEQGLHPRIEAVNPQDFLQGIVRGHSKAGISITLDTDDMPVVAFFDENLLGLALDATLQNALRFAKSTIVVGCKTIAEETVFTVQDDGPGLGTEEAQQSTGMGMALCAAIAAAHRNGERQGRTRLHDLPQGGALFCLYLP